MTEKNTRFYVFFFFDLSLSRTRTVSKLGFGIKTNNLQERGVGWVTIEKKKTWKRTKIK